MEVYLSSDKGKVRKLNEDAAGVFYNQNDHLLVVLADGMGGHQAGDVASQLVIQSLEQSWENTGEFESLVELEEWLKEAIGSANQMIIDYSEEHPECAGMGTTVVAATIYGDDVVSCHVGDSRLYHLDDSEIYQITEDHSYVYELVKSGEISEEEAEDHPKKNILLQALGTEQDVKIDINTFKWSTNDSLIICTDGLTNKLSSKDLYEIARSEMDIEEVVTQMVSSANDRGGEDNITVAYLKNVAPEEGEASC
ncbi:protein phosphatase [Halalkalibacillus sediminis]|uniref:protein-serine/threonine phosphatase n=1 Tax=Halalkalibacillus sediminis TaxID=2018042 RepID=A0A2I0QW60_9BACI|nr:Stp1/IreP family PP2C-type Ser/Thr phosphatase [Halalkalibacillus sediminis]PKR78572.1 protein phosphatase [Halalkalibacillus sediminis]